MFIHKISVHGAPFMAEKRLESNDCASGYTAAKSWAKDVPIDTKRVELQSCYGATGGPFSNAQMLSNRTGLPVIGYAGKVSNVKGEPEWFTPQSSGVAAFTGKVNDAIGSAKTWGRTSP
ncbi:MULTISPECIES: hypothetical protein [Paraburkholderia]|uniref:Uncharacterized protein n=2 Tax=Paraburkholderia TaxID=1822464 RepID=A0A7Y9WJ22_9BURK|nr:hypothetical protein [Paraburkholderia bryophila]NYH21779.1 hypothetical protein [Paraburkholderia bryophila]